MNCSVLVLAGYYEPAVKAGGPIRSIKNMVETLGGQFEFFILASDRDHGDSEVLDGVTAGVWTEVGAASVFYAPPRYWTIWRLQRLIQALKPDYIYCNSFFSYRTSIIPVLLNRLMPRTSPRVIIAPRGEFSPGALTLRRWKKSLFLAVSKLGGLHQGLRWHATTDQEADLIRGTIPQAHDIVVAGNIAGSATEKPYHKIAPKVPGSLKVVYVSRIHPKKNLLAAIEAVAQLDGDVRLEIYGPVEDRAYWAKCESSIANAKPGVTILHLGVVEHAKVDAIFQDNHVFLLPTLGENFGHVIAEALLGGCPVITTDQTPWSELEVHSAGHNVPLEEFWRVPLLLQGYLEMGQREYDETSRAAHRFATNRLDTPREAERHATLFTD